MRRDATRLGTGTPHDLVFLDPPYGKGLGEKAMVAALAGGWLAPHALIVWEDSAEITPPEGVTLLDRRTFGGTRMSFLEGP